MRFTAIAALLLLTACASQQVAGNSAGIATSVSGRNVADVTRDIQGWHNAQHRDCPFNRVVSAAVVERDRESAQENWTIEACDQKQFTYRVFVMFQDGGISDMVSNADDSRAN